MLMLYIFLNHLIDSELGHADPQASIIVPQQVLQCNMLAVKLSYHPRWSMCYDTADIEHLMR